MRLLVPPKEEIKWPRKSRWIRAYLREGRDGMSPDECVSASHDLGIKSPSAEDMDRRLVYLLSGMNYTLGALREFFERPDVKPRPDLDAVYGYVAAQHAPMGVSSIEPTPFVEMLKILRAHLDTPEGHLSLLAREQWPWLRVMPDKSAARMLLREAYKRASRESIRMLVNMPEYDEVEVDLKRLVYEPWIFKVRALAGNNYSLHMKMDFLLRHGLFPENLVNYSCKRRPRRS